MTNKSDTSLECFRSGLNCAQAVVTAFADDLHYDLKQAQGLTAGLGAGMGRLQNTCGAVTGAFMVIGIWQSQKHTDTARIREESYASIREFSGLFCIEHKSTQCSKLLGCDLLTQQGQDYFKENNLFQNVCEKCILSAVSILERFMNDTENPS